MAERPAARAGAGGGGGVQAARRLGPGVAAALGAVAAAAAVAAYAPLLAGRFQQPLLGGGAVALFLLALALATGWAPLVPAAVFVLGCAYGAALLLRGHAFDGRAPLVAGALVACAELAWWTLELRTSTVDEGRVLVRRLLVAVVTVGGATLVATFVGAAATIDLGAAAAWEAVAVAGAVGALALIVALTRPR